MLVKGRAVWPEKFARSAIGEICSVLLEQSVKGCIRWSLLDQVPVSNVQDLKIVIINHL